MTKGRTRWYFHALQVLLLALISWDQFWAVFDHDYAQFQNINPFHIVLMMIPFWWTVVFTWQLAIKPLVKVIEERENRTLGARAEAADFETRFNERHKAYEERLASTRKQAAEERARARRETEALAEKALGRAREEAGRTLETVRGEIGAERARVSSELKRHAAELAHELAEKALGREIPSAGGSKRGGARSEVRS